MNLFKLQFIALICFGLAIFNSIELKAQCSATISNGQSLVTNGDFSQGYTGWTFQSPDYTSFTPCGSSCYSVPGKIYAGNKSTDFNSAFNMGAGIDIPDHTATADNNMLMVDGVCTAGVDLWSETNIPISPTTNYYFTVWITAMDAASPHGTLQFVINGTALPTTITPSNTTGQWTQFTYVWNSGAAPPATATIQIQNTTTTGCNNAVDFAIDDISFTPGCDFGSAGPIPNLGPDFTICGKTTPFYITPHFTPTDSADATIAYTWYKNGVIQAVNSGTGPIFYRLPVTSAGTYSVCTQQGGNCPKTDILVITSTFSINLGPPITLCDPVTATLDAGYTGPGVKYKWYNSYPTRAGGNDSARTLAVTAAGTYRVDVIDPICGTQSGTVVVNSNAATPTNTTYCAGTSATVSVAGPGKYKWWSAKTGGTVLATGPTYTKTGLTPPTNYTFYVEDTSTFSLTAGPSAAANDPSSGSAFGSFINPFNVNAGSTAGKLIFNAVQDFKIDTISVLVNNYYCPTPGVANDQVIIEVKYPASLGGGNVPGSPKTYSSPCTIQNNGGLPARIMKVPLGFNLVQANGYQMNLSSGSPNSILGFLNATNGGSLPTPVRYSYPTTYTYGGNPVVDFAANSSADYNLYYSPTAFPGYFDWKITKGINCDSVPVSITYSCTLPVNYLDFTVKANSSSSGLIQWQTSSEVNADRFVIQRSYDGIHFTDIATIKAYGNSKSIQSYSYTDYGLASGTVYYKIAQYDINGQVNYTDIKTLNINLNKISVYPNPTKGSFTLSLAGAKGSQLKIELINSIGQVVVEHFITDNIDLFEQTIEMQGFTSGVYFLKVQSDTEKWLEKIIKE